MKSIITSLLIAALLMMPVAYAEEAKETVKVCVDVVKDGKPVMDKKTGKAQQQCKVMKAHKKLEGHAVPEKK